jgi:phosphopantetheinyl transferase
MPLRVWSHFEVNGVAAIAPRTPAEVLTARERSQYQRFEFVKRRDDWLSGRLAAKHLIARMLREYFDRDTPALGIEIEASPAGAPIPVNATASGLPGLMPGARLPLELSISHSRGAAFAAAFWRADAKTSRARIGADLEWIEPRPPDLFDDYFTEEERRYCGHGHEKQDERATIVWSAKESTLKAAGLGLTIDTRAVTCLPDTGPASLRTDPPGPWRGLSIVTAPPLSSSIVAAQGCWKIDDGFAFTIVVAECR